MKTKIFENARFIPKGDIETNWNKAAGFIPLDKEIIIYKADENHPVARMKVGDGMTAVQDLPFIDEHLVSKEELEKQIAEFPQADYEQYDEAAADYIKNRPFYEKYEIIPAKEYVPMGSPEDPPSDCVESNYDIGFPWSVLTKEKISFPNDTIFWWRRIEGYYDYDNGLYVYTKDELYQASGQPTWLYYTYYNDNEELVRVDIGWCVKARTDYLDEWVEKVIIPERSIRDIKQLDEKFIPDTIARTKTVDELKAEVTEVKESIVQPDWNQNDASAADYVKNRPFYTEVKEGAQIPIEITILGSDSGDEVGSFIAEYKGKFTPESILTVELDGKVYENLEPFTITDGDDTALWGNPYYVDSTLVDNGVPFIFGVVHELTDSGADGNIECEIYSSNPDLSTFKISRILQERLICDVNNIQGIIDNSSDDSIPSNSAASLLPLNSIDITTDDMVTVTFNGKVYENLKLEKYEPVGAIVAGNKSLINSSFPDTKEPFCFTIGLDEQGNVVSGGACGSSLTVDEYDWSDFSVSTVRGSIKIQKLDTKYLPDGLATEEYVDEKIDAIKLPKVPTNYITTNTNQTNLSGTKTYTSGLIFNPNNSLKYSKTYTDEGAIAPNIQLEDIAEFNWINNSLKFTTLSPGATTLPNDSSSNIPQIKTYYSKNGFKIEKVNRNTGYGIEGTTEGFHIFRTLSGEALPYHTYYRYNSIVHSEADIQNSGSLPEVTLTFPTESGMLATREWVNENVKLDLDNELILGKDTITEDDHFYTTGTYTNTGITLKDRKFGGVVDTTTTYGHDYISFYHSNSTGDNETYGEPKSCNLTFPNGNGTIATQEYVGSKINGLPQEPGWKITRYVLNHSFKTYNDVTFYHEGFANFIEYESLADSTKHKIIADIHITSEETISEPSDIGIKILTTTQVGNKWESKPLYVNNVFPEGFLDNTKYTNITVDKYQWITDITQDAIGRFNSNGSIGPVLYADRSNGFVPLVWGNGLELDTYNDGQPLIIGGKEIKVTYYDYYNIVSNKKS